MSNDARATVEKLLAALAEGDLDTVAALYAHDAELVRYDGAAKGPAEIQAFYERYLANHGRYDLEQIVDFRAVDDVVIWDALVDTDAGQLMSYDVAILDDTGRIARHVPAIRGYFGL